MGADGAMGADGKGEVAHRSAMAAVDEMLQNRSLLGPGGGLSVREMRKALSARGIAHERCIEKAELEALTRS